MTENRLLNLFQCLTFFDIARWMHVPVSGLYYFSEIFNVDVQFFLIPAGTELGNNQCLCQFFFIGHMNLVAIVKRAFSTSCTEMLLEHWIIDYCNFSFFLDQQCNRYACMWKAMHKIQCAIHGIDNPRRAVRQFTFCAFTRWFFANEADEIEKKRVNNQNSYNITNGMCQTNRWCGNSALNVLISNFSTSWSVSVTRSMSLNFCFTLLLFQNRLAINWNAINNYFHSQ